MSKLISLCYIITFTSAISLSLYAGMFLAQSATSFLYMLIDEISSGIFLGASLCIPLILDESQILSQSSS